MSFEIKREKLHLTKENLMLGTNLIITFDVPITLNGRTTKPISIIAYNKKKDFYVVVPFKTPADFSQAIDQMIAALTQYQALHPEGPSNGGNT